MVHVGWAAGEKLWKTCNAASHSFIKGLYRLNLAMHQGRWGAMNRSEDAECCISLWWKTSCLAFFSSLRPVIMRFLCFPRSIGRAKRTSQSKAERYQTVQVVYCANRCLPDHKYASTKLWSEVRRGLTVLMEVYRSYEGRGNRAGERTVQ